MVCSLTTRDFAGLAPLSVVILAFFDLGADSLVTLSWSDLVALSGFCGFLWLLRLLIF